MDPDEELPALDPQPDEQEAIDEAARQQLLAARQNPPAAQRQQGPLGAQVYDRTAAALAAARKGPEALAQYLEQQHGYQFDNNYNGTQAGAPSMPGVQLPQPGAPPVGAAPAQSDYQQQLAALQARIEQNQRTQEQGVEAAFQRTRPSESEKWLGIAAALASPTQYGSFGETMGNVFQSLLGYKQGVRQAESTRQSELAKLRQSYDLANINAMARGLKPPAAPQSVWSESLGRFVPKDRVVAVASGVTKDGHQFTKYSDGTLGRLEPDGSIAVYDADGSRIGTRTRGEVQ